MKTIIFALGLLVLCSAQLPHFWESSPFLPNIQNEIEDESVGLDPKSSLQLIFDGLWEQGGLNAPKDIINCFNQQSANETLNFIGKMLTDIGRSNAVDITKTVIEYEKTISISTVYCFGNDTELTDLRVAYGVSNLTVPQLYVAIEKYILLHLKNLTTSAAAASFYFDQAQYKQVGTLLGQVAQTIVNKTHEESAQTEVEQFVGLDPKQSLQLIFDGLWEQGGLNDPKDIINCFNENSANDTLNFIGKLLVDISRGNAVDIPKTILTFEKSLSTSTIYCFGNDTELKDLRVAYKLSNLTVPQMYVAMEKYIVLHLNALRSYASSADFDFTQGQYKQTGVIFGQVIQDAVNKTSEDEFVGLDPKQSLQLIFDGLWEQGGLNDPKDIINCFNEQSANETLNFIGKLLVDISRGNAVDIPTTILAYEKTISTSTIYCFGNDTELKDLRVAYKLSNLTVPQMYVAMEKYILLHLAALRSYASSADFDFTQGQYKQTGVIFGQVIQDAVNKTSEDEFVGLDPKQSLQLIFDGLWEQGGLNDPKDIINCFNENSANDTLNFIGKLLADISRGNAVDIPKTIITFEKSLSTSTIYCFGNDTELRDLRVAYKLSNLTVPQMYVAMEKYILLHLAALRSYASSADFDFTQGQYKQTGVIFGQVIQDAVNKTSEVEVRNDDPLSDLQSLLNGIFEQAGLPDPTKIAQCFNETTAQVTLDFFGDVVNDLAKDDYLSLIREYHVYAASIPKNVSDCIKNDPETTEVYNAYGFNNENGKTLLQKYLTFGIKHHLQLLNDTKTITNDMASGDYTDAGKATGILVQAILGGTDLFSEEQIADGLEDVIQDMILNGY